MRFTIRDLLWLTVVVALVVTWWVDRSRLMGTLRKIEFAMQNLDITSVRIILRDFQEDYGPAVRELPNPSAPAPTPAKK